MDSKVLIMGATFKEDVSDIRNSKVIDVIREIESFSITVDVIDPYADPAEVNQEYGYKTKNDPNGPYDAVIVAVNHSQYNELPQSYFEDLMPKGGVFVDIKGGFKNMANSEKLEYWSL
jgi:UDP-N-acetyl-D-galactosamine dehydrogenase